MSVISSEARSVRAPAVTINWLGTPLFFWGVLVFYLAAHIALRLWETPNLGKNDVQEALAAHGWAWGYHPRNPPLHTWLLMASYSVFGVGLLAHVVLKYVLLGATYAFAYLSGRRLLSTNALAAVCAFSLSLLTPFAWTVHTALTHTLLLAAMIFITLWAGVRLTTHRRWLDYALFGAVIGLGLLAKYSYPLFLVPLVASMLCQAEFRRVVLDPKSLASLAAAALVFAPHAIWMMSARFDFVQFLAEKQQSHAAHPYVADVALGFVNVATGALTFLAPLLVVAALLLRRQMRIVAAPLGPWARTLLLVPVFGLGLLLLDAIVLRATQFEERYFMCALLVAPVVMFAWVDRRASELGGRTLAKFAAGVLAAALIVAAGLGAKALFYNQSCSRCWDEMAIPDLVRQIRSESGFRSGTIIADHYNVAGNLSIAFPDARVIAANYVVDAPRQDRDGQCLVVWNARNAGDPMPASLVDQLEQRHLTPPPGEPVYVDALLLRSEHRTDRFAYWLLPDADGNCEPRTEVAELLRGPSER
jgi:hypothetical protein